MVQKKDKKKKLVQNDDYLSTEEVTKMIQKTTYFRNKFNTELLEYSPVNFSTPTWKYIKMSDEFEYDKLTEFEKKEIEYKIKNDNQKNSEHFLEGLGEKGLLLCFYKDDEVFDIYHYKDFKVKVFKTKIEFSPCKYN